MVPEDGDRDKQRAERMKFSEPNSAECYEQSECENKENQQIADDLDKIDLILFQVQNSLRASRIRIQKEEGKVEMWHDLNHFQEIANGLLSTARQIREAVHRQSQDIRTETICPSEWLTRS